jgi:hypothetical protein
MSRTLNCWFGRTDLRAAAPHWRLRLNHPRLAEIMLAV